MKRTSSRAQFVLFLAWSPLVLGSWFSETVHAQSLILVAPDGKAISELGPNGVAPMGFRVRPGIGVVVSSMSASGAVDVRGISAHCWFPARIAADLDGSLNVSNTQEIP